MTQTITLSWCCGYFVGAPYWQMLGDWTYEPDECDTDFDTEEDYYEFLEGYITATCPRCGAELELTYDCPVAIVQDEPVDAIDYRKKLLAAERAKDPDMWADIRD